MALNTYAKGTNVMNPLTEGRLKSQQKLNAESNTKPISPPPAPRSKSNTDTKYVWLNLKTGEFSNSWDKEFMQYVGGIDKIVPEGGTKWKLIKYECLNDKEFEFIDKMRIA